MRDDALSSIIGNIYDCVLEPEGWGRVLAQLAQHLDAAYTTISLNDAVSTVGRMAAHSPWDVEQLRILNEEYGIEGVPGLNQVFRLPVDTAFATLTHMRETEFQASAFYQNWAKPQGLRDGVLVKFVHTNDRIGVMAAVTRASRPPVTAEEQRLMMLVSPHFRRAGLISDLLDHTRVAEMHYRASMDKLASAVLLLSGEGALIYANPVAESMLEQASPLALINRRITPENPTFRQAFQQAVASAANSDIDIEGRGIGIPLSMQGKAPAVAYVLPLAKGTARQSLRPATVAVFISTTTSSQPPPESVLVALFDLTPTEARIAQALAIGKSSTDVQIQMGISENTMKTHLSNVFKKTGTHRQADLLALVAGLAAPIT